MLVLASASPRRAELLRRLRLEFEVRPAGAEEPPAPGAQAPKAALTLARAKAEAVARPMPEGWVLAADTLLEHHRRVLGKPKDAADALTMLEQLQGSEHEVYTALCVARQPGMHLFQHVERSVVHLARLDRATLEAYVATGEPLGKAGAYAVQGIAAAYVTRIEGSVDNVVGLPVRPMLQLLAASGYPLPPHLRA